MTRVQLHNRSVELVRRALAAGGFQVEPGGRHGGPAEAAGRFDLIVENLTVAVRVAKRSTFPWNVVVGGKRYNYRYHGHRWNLHSHGSTKLRPDVWVFVAASRRVRFFVVLGRRVSGFYTLTLREPSKTWLLGCENRWEAIRELTAARPSKAA
jgi:hypothetical protein